MQLVRSSEDALKHASSESVLLDGEIAGFHFQERGVEKLLSIHDFFICKSSPVNNSLLSLLHASIAPLSVELRETG